jgi:hypothetical protein
VQAHKKKGPVDFLVSKDWSIWLIVGVLIGLYIAPAVHYAPGVALGMISDVQKYVDSLPKALEQTLALS